MSSKVLADARPALPVSEDSLWDAAARKRDDLVALVDDEFKKDNIEAWIRKSQPGEYPAYVGVESWRTISETELTTTFDRSSLWITIEVTPFRENPLSYKVELNRHGRKFKEEHWKLSDSEVRELVHFLIHGGSKPSFFEPRVPLALRLIGAFIPFFGSEPKNKLIREARTNYMTLPSFLGWGGAISIVASFLLIAAESEAFFFPVVLGVGFIIAGAVITTRRQTLDAVPKQSARAPRQEYRVDSWHVSVPGAGAEFAAFRNRIYDALRLAEPTAEAQIEMHQNFTPRGFEERERLVLTKGQATLHVHVYPFAPDAFVGWDSHLNWKRWAETGSVSTTVRDGKRVKYHSLEAGGYAPTEFDLIDADALAETTHRVIVEEIKAFLKERELEADLDFQIIRGDREKALHDGGKDKKKREKKV